MSVLSECFQKTDKSGPEKLQKTKGCRKPAQKGSKTALHNHAASGIMTLDYVLPWAFCAAEKKRHILRLFLEYTQDAVWLRMLCGAASLVNDPSAKGDGAKRVWLR